MFGSGMVKLTSRDPTWRNLTALGYHCSTPPLPPLSAWFMAQLPDGFQRFSCVYMFGVELLAPFLIFGPRKLRPAAFFLLGSLQLFILLTGNYCFFNYLSLGLCFFVLEDAVWPGWFKRWWAASPKPGILPEMWPFRWPPWV